MKIKLKPFTRDDFNRLIGWIPSPEFLLQFGGTLFHYPLDQRQLELYLQEAEKDPPTRRIYKAIDIEAGLVVGHIELENINVVHRSASVARVLVGEASARGKGVGEQMMRLILKIGFEELNLHRMMLGVFDFNTPAIRCYEKVGFLKEGLLRDIRKIGDEYWNLYLMSILESEWKVNDE